MKCPFCNCFDTQVIDSRVSEEGDTIRRRRRCTSCDRRFTTYERVDLMMPSVVKRNGTRVDFDAQKLHASMALALRKRPVSAIALDAAVIRIQEALLTSGEREIPSSRIGELVMAELRQMDQVAYVRFASVYQSFEDVHEFAQAINEFRNHNNGNGHS